MQQMFSQKLLQINQPSHYQFKNGVFVNFSREDIALKISINKLPFRKFSVLKTVAYYDYSEIKCAGKEKNNALD